MGILLLGAPAASEAPPAPQLIDVLAVEGGGLQFGLWTTVGDGDEYQIQITSSADTSYSSPERDVTGTIDADGEIGTEIDEGFTGLTPGATRMRARVRFSGGEWSSWSAEQTPTVIA